MWKTRASVDRNAASGWLGTPEQMKFELPRGLMQHTR